MTKNEKLVWRLKEQPTTEALQSLVQSGLLTKEEAREILFSSEKLTGSGERDESSLKSEITFLRELVQKLSESKTKTVEVIRDVEIRYTKYPWYEPYQWYCTSTAGGNSITTLEGTGSTMLVSANSATNLATVDFTNIKTF